MNSRTVVVCLLLIGACRSPQPAAMAQSRSASEKYDGAWWQAASPSERTGFIDGFYECYRGDVGGQAFFRSTTMEAHRDLVTAYYQGSATHLGESVVSAISEVRDTSLPMPIRVDRHPQGHSELDGTEWRGMVLDGKGLGFVRGYVACLQHYLPSQGGTFTGATVDYERWIESWYGKDGDLSAPALEREYTPIAVVLLRVSLGDTLGIHSQ